MDLDGDGVRDIVTGCWPKVLFLFRGRPEGEFAAPEPILDEDRAPIEPGKASTVFAVDWDKDGDLDLLAGNIDGEIYLIPNRGARDGHAFGKMERFEAGSVAIRVEGGDSGPVAADWDGDGQIDLLSGSGSGDVVWYRNTAKEGRPTLAAARVLVKGQTGGIGKRTKIAVADWNDDGQLDLLVGDFGSDRSRRRSWSREEMESHQRAYEEFGRVQSEWSKFITRPAVSKKQRSERTEKLLKLQKRLDEARTQAENATKGLPNLYSVYRGNVWLFLRKSSLAKRDQGDL